MKKAILILAVLALTLVAGCVQEKQEVYFDDEAQVQFFWSRTCRYCEAEKPIIKELAEDEGYRWQSMLIDTNRQYISEYDIEGTPTFIHKPTGDRLTGFQDKEVLKAWMDEHGGPTVTV